MAMQLSGVAERFVARVENLLDERLHQSLDAGADSQRCSQCAAIVPAIRPIPFEYCPYCESTLETFESDQGAAPSPLTRLLDAFFTPVGSGSEPTRSKPLEL